MKRKIIYLSILASILFVSVSKANSMPTYAIGDRGVNSVTLLEEGCPIEVQKEVLTFDLQEFPKEYYETAKELKSYMGEVTAEYIFYNPTDEEIRAKLAFPFGNKPTYASYQIAGELAGEWWKKDITVDGKSVEPTLRFTYFPDVEFDAYKEREKLINGYMEDEFYKPDLPVKKYSYDIQTDTKEDTYVEASLILDMEKTESKILTKGCIRGWDGSKKKGTIAVDVENSQVEFYVLGENDFELEWKFRDWEKETDVDGKATLNEIEEMSFEEFVSANLDEIVDGTKADKYNACVMYLKDCEQEKGIVADCYIEYLRDSLMYWYEYEVMYPPGETVKNSVTAPIYPAVEAAYEPPIYEYKYLLSPAKLWSDFGEMEIRIHTPFYLTDSSIKGFEKTENGYRLMRKGLPGKEFEFVLSESEHPKMDRDIISYRLTVFFYFIGIPVLFVGGIAFIFFRIRRKRKKERS